MQNPHERANALPVRPTGQSYFPEDLVQKCCVTVRGIRSGFRKGGKITVGEMLEEERVRTATLHVLALKK